MRRHFEGPQFDQAQSGTGSVGRIQFVDTNLAAMGIPREIRQEIAKDAVDRPWSDVLARARVRYLVEGDCQFVEGVGARFIHPRMLAGGTNEESGEKVRERGMILPEPHQAAE